VRTALYFPHTEVRDEKLLRTALLTWDKLEYIAPHKGYKPRYQNADFEDAMSLIGHPRCPTDDDKAEVHDLVADLIKDGVPEIFQYTPAGGRQGDDYEMWPGKLAPTTWGLLAEKGMIGHRLSNYDYPASQTAGLSLMSLLADVMAGTTKTRVTDRSEAYAAIANATRPLKAVTEDSSEMVVPLTFKAINLDRVPTRTLIKYREKELGSDGHSVSVAPRPH